jgi:pyruvate/2-oxoacid:ferredoxin oxidoreductase beta subunit
VKNVRGARQAVVATSCVFAQATGPTSAGRTGLFGAAAAATAGNATNPRAQVITAAGEGSAAAIGINADLVEEDVRRAPQRGTAP